MLSGKRLSRWTKRAGNYLLPSRWEYFCHKQADSYLISYPKCGRTWLRFMIGKTLQYQYGFNTRDPLDLEMLTRQQPELPVIRVTHDDDPHLKKGSKIIRDKSRYCNKSVVFLIRDPRDVLVSYYFHITKRYPKHRRVYDGSLCDLIEEPVGGLRSILRFFNIWAESRSVPRDFLLARYEDLHQKPKTVLREIFSFLGIENVSDGFLEQAIRATSFQNMKNLEEAGAFPGERLYPGDASDPDSYKVRRGKIGGFVDYLPQADVLRINRIIDEELSDFYAFYKHS